MCLDCIYHRHQCQLPCHPGPCPPCPVMVTRYCPCGRKKHQVSSCMCSCMCGSSGSNYRYTRLVHDGCTHTNIVLCRKVCGVNPRVSRLHRVLTCALLTHMLHGLLRCLQLLRQPCICTLPIDTIYYHYLHVAAFTLHGFPFVVSTRLPYGLRSPLLHSKWRPLRIL